MMPSGSFRYIGPFALYIIGVAVLFPFYAHMMSPDTISYLSIAQHYVEHNWMEAVNTYWSPMFSWLLAPLLELHIPGLLAARLVCFVSGLMALYGVLLLGRGFELRNGFLLVALYVAAAMVLAFALLRQLPDLLEAALLLFYFRLIFDREYPLSRRMGLWCGLLGGAAFLTKGYALYFFLGHFTLMNVLHALLGPKDRRNGLAANFAQGLAAFVLIAAPWIGMMSVKAGRFTAGTTGEFNYRWLGPDSPGYVQYYALIPPSGEHAISMWEEPAPSLLPRWSPLHSGREFRHELRLIETNLRVLVRMFLYTSLLSIPILLLYGISGWNRETPARYHWLLPMVSVALLPAGYLLFTVQDRYLWSIFLLLPLMGAVILQKYLASLSGPLPRLAAVCCFAGSFLLIPARMLMVQRHADDRIFQLGARIRQRAELHGRLASCGNWNDSLYIAYYLGLRFYGSTGATAAEYKIARELNPSKSSEPADPDPDRVSRDLAVNEISYYLVWPTCRYVPPEVLAHPEITGVRSPELKIYDLSASK